MAGAERLHAEAGGVEGQTFVYVIGSEDGPQKVGRTANPALRLRGLQTGNPHHLELFAAINVSLGDAAAVERYAHTVLSLRRLSGEWFRVTPDRAIEVVQEAMISVTRKQIAPAPEVLLCEQLRAARAILRWRAVDLAEKAGVNLSTIQRAEKADGPVPMMPANEKAVRETLEAAGIQFISENGGGAGVRLRKQDQ